MATDPVCGMSVDPAKAAAHTEYHGKTYYLCSAQCLGAFKADPGRYVGSTPSGGTPKLALVGAHGGDHPMHQHAMPAPAQQKKSKQLAKDPICGMMVDKATALTTEPFGSRTTTS